MLPETEKQVEKSLKKIQLYATILNQLGTCSKDDKDAIELYNKVTKEKLKALKTIYGLVSEGEGPDLNLVS